MPNRNTSVVREWPTGYELIVLRLGAVDHIGDHCPIETGVPHPFLNPAVVFLPIDRNTLLPDGESSVI
jgi:hypothetical protein